jgi:dTDP-4-dehydrorhamnose 3,5-epimerase
MEFIKTPLDGLLLVKPDIFKDDRGYFFESYNEAKYSKAGINYNFAQVNISKSIKNTIRGLHYQIGDFAQGKLCSVLVGKVLDVAVDIRKSSPTFGKYFSAELSDENKFQLWVPPGFAHGFSVLSEEAIFVYKCTALYNKESERSIFYADTDLKIDWGIENPVLSQKDLIAPKFSEAQLF